MGVAVESIPFTGNSIFAATIELSYGFPKIASMNWLKGLGLLVLLLVSQQAQGQLNLKIGYSLSLAAPENVNRTIRAYNAANPWFNKPMRELNLVNGVNIGFRNKWDGVALEFSWSSKFSTKDIEGIRPIDNENFFRETTFRLGSFSFGPEFFFGDFGIGATVDITDLEIRTNKTQQPTELLTVDDSYISSHFFVSYYINTGDFLTLCFRPFVHVPYETVNVFEFEQELFPGTTNTAEGYEDNFVNFGLMIIFYNGNP